MKNVAMLLSFLALFISCKTYDKLKLSESLTKMVARDQEVQNLIMANGGKDKVKLDSLNSLKKEIFKDGFLNLCYFWLDVLSYPKVHHN